MAGNFRWTGICLLQVKSFAMDVLIVKSAMNAVYVVSGASSGIVQMC